MQRDIYLNVGKCKGGAWVGSQRKSFKRGELSPDQIERLELLTDLSGMGSLKLSIVVPVLRMGAPDDGGSPLYFV
jgi:hypothetical protein